MNYYRYPIVAQELLCNSSMISLALVEGGWVPEEKDEVEADDENDE